MVFDPFEINRKLFSEWEKKLAEFMDKRMRDPDFMKVVGQGITATMDAKSHIDARLEEWFRTLNLPTKDDMEKVWTTVNALETRLIDLEDRVAALEKKQPIWAGPAIKRADKPKTAKKPRARRS
jgi:BMFP domain-containing protein YqiC